MTARWVLLAGALVASACVGGDRTAPDAPHRLDTAATAVPVEIHVDTSVELGPISPLIRGVSGYDDVAQLRDIGATVTSWGGNPSSRYNPELGNAWNAGSDWGYRNTDYGNQGDAAIQFLDDASAAGAAVRLAVPTLGWVAADTDDTTCSFPDGDGGCTDGQAATCAEPGPVADPTTANRPSTPTMVRTWVERLQRHAGPTLRYIAFDNEPELWGYTHYDVHPGCTTYEEVLDRHLRYADALRQAAPDALFAAPVTCCWFDYWGIAPGPATGEHEEFLPWFLDRLRAHERATGRRVLDVLDVHYYPQGGVFNDEADPSTAARRLRSTRSLHDPHYVDESWIDEPIAFIPRMRRLIDQHHPGLQLGISEWNFGADTTMNGALAIADVLAIYGREGVDMAAYWRNPPAGSPGSFAFKLHGNHDDRGGHFGGTAVAASSSEPDLVRAYAAIDDGRLQILLLNLDPSRSRAATVDPGGPPMGGVTLHRYSEAAPDRIVSEPIGRLAPTHPVVLPPYSMTLLVAQEPAA